MAGDWIKMRTVLQTSPKVVRISSALDADRLKTVGGLHSAWCLFDAHSDDGFLEGYTPEILDQMIGWSGFTEAMASVGWIAITPEGLELPEFDAHNGKSAKRRAQEADRKRQARESAKTSALDADKNGTREEKRREEYIDNSSELSSGESEPDVPREKFTEQDFEMATKIYESILLVAPKTKKPNLKKWADDVRLMREQDGHSHAEIREVFMFANTDEFWKTNILSTSKLRKQFSTLHSKMTNGGRNAGINGSSRRPSEVDRQRQIAAERQRQREAKSGGPGTIDGEVVGTIN